MKKEKKEVLQRTVEKFIVLDADVKDFITGYMTGIEHERAKWEKKFEENKAS